MKNLKDVSPNEHILVCISSAPSNAKIIRTAAKMADAFCAVLTAIYVQTPEHEKMKDSDRQRLEYHISIAQQRGANVVTVYGDDVPGQIAEYAKLSDVTKIITGRKNAVRKFPWSRPSLTEHLVKISPDTEIHIIPDSLSDINFGGNKLSLPEKLMPPVSDIGKTLFILTVATVIGIVFQGFNFTESNIITVYILGVLLTSLVTQGYISSVLASMGSVLVFNFFFTEPRLTLHAYASGYPFTFMIMLIASLITGTLATKLKDTASQSAQAAFRTQILLETNQKLQKAINDAEILEITANQLMRLLDRDVAAYPDSGNPEDCITALCKTEKNPFSYYTEQKAALWVLKNGRRAGCGTEIMPELKGMYLPVKANNKTYGTIGIYVYENHLDSFENSIVMSVLGECALAVESNRNAREKEEAAVIAKNEQLRANLLSSISHDLRTPLTSISGNASNLMSNYTRMDDTTRQRIFTDIYDDSMWLINIVENLLSVTKIAEGKMNLRLSAELIDEIIYEALAHVNRNREKRTIAVDIKDDLLIARVDAKLIIQVIINLLDNAIKYTPAATPITITAEKSGNMICISVADKGAGIPDNSKPFVFDKFYTGSGKIADSRRSLGLGLSLCKSIIDIHGGTISLKDNIPHGCIFTFTLPLSEVEIHE